MAKQKEQKLEAEENLEADDLFIPDIPMPAEDAGEKDIIKDECKTAFKFAFVGSGQGGSRIVESFYKLGYRRVCAVNTTNQDLININIPEKNKLVMDIGEGGAGKDPAKGEKAIKQYYEEVYDLMRRSFGSNFDRIIVAVGSGGGSGSGSLSSLINIAHDIAKSFKIENEGHPSVGVLVSLPMNSEGQKVNANSVHVLESLFERVGKDKGRLSARDISPLIIVDNDRISDLYPGLPVTEFWNVANQSISSLFHLFNTIAGKDSEFTTFDRADLKDILSSGVITFGATPLSKYDSPTDISFAIRDNLKKNILAADIDLSVAQVAGCIFVGHPEVLSKIPQDNLEHGFEMLGRIMKGEKGTVHRGIYKGGVRGRDGKPGIVVYTVLGELGRPQERMAEIYNIAKIKAAVR